MKLSKPTNQRFGILSSLILGLTLIIAIPISVFANNNHPLEVSAATVITTKSSDQYITSYYSSISDSQTGLPLASSLETRLQAERNNSFSYGSLQTSAFPYTDVDPLRPTGGYIVSFYSGTPVYGYTGMNKEHTWPKSHGGGLIENDPHMVRPTLTSENSARGNSYYAESPSNGWDPATFNNAKYRGIAARIIFYGAVIGYTEGLRLEDVGFVSGSGNGGEMGKLSDLLRWNYQYPVDQSEIIRNETLDISLNYNRNPFIDNPSYACRIWGSVNSTTQSICASQNVEPTTITLSPSSGTVNMGSTLELTVSATPTNADKSVTWSTANSSIATVSGGTVTPVGVGQTTITATSTRNASIKGTATITVTNNPVSVTSVSLNKSTENITVGNTTTLTATVLPANASNKAVSWSSSNTSVASINSTTGLITGVAEGTSTITVTTADGNKTATCSLTVALPSGQDTYTKVTSISDISASYQYVFGTESSGYHYSGTETWGLTALPNVQSPLIYSLSVINENLKTFTAKTNISGTDYYLTVPTSNAWTMTADSSTLLLGTTYGSEDASAVANSGTPTRHIRQNGTSGLRSYASATGIIAYFYKVQKSSKTLTSINVSGTPTKTSYYAGESFSPAGISVMATYSDSSTLDVTASCTFSPNPLTADTTSVTVSYTDSSGTKTSIINGITVQANNLEHISIKTHATNTTFPLGSAFSSSGLIITATYESGTTNDLTTGFEVSAVDTSVLGQQTVDISYGGQTTSYNVTITNQGASVSSGSGGYATDLFISEYIEGNIGNNKAIEIYNGTGTAVSLANYKAALYSNGSATAGSTTDLSTFFATLGHGQVLTIVNAGATTDFKVGNYIESTVTYFNGDDAVALLKNDSVIDLIGVIGTDPGSAWTDGGSKSTANQTLVRNSNIASPNTTFTWSEWSAYPADTSTYVGAHTFDGGQSSGDVTAAEQAIAWAQYFLSTTNQICIADGSTNTEDLQSGWSALSSEYGYMANDAKDAFVDNVSSNTAITNAKARYIYIVEKYDFANYVTDGSGTKMISSNVVSSIPADDNLLLVIVTLSILLGTAVCALLVLKRKHFDIN